MLCNPISHNCFLVNSPNYRSYSKTSHTNHLYRSTPSLYRPAFHNTKIKSTIYSQYFGKFCKWATSLNGPHEFTATGGRFREVLLYFGESLSSHLVLARVCEGDWSRWDSLLEISQIAFDSWLKCEGCFMFCVSCWLLVGDSIGESVGLIVCGLAGCQLRSCPNLNKQTFISSHSLLLENTWPI